MVTRSPHKRLLIAAALVLGLVAFAPGTASAAMQTFITQSGSTDSAGEAVKADVTFVTGTNSITITLNNDIVNQRSVGQNVSDLLFTVSGSPTSPSISSSSAPIRTVNSNGTYSDSAASSTGWALTSSGGTIHLNGLAGATYTPSHTLIGLPDPVSNTYSNADSSITGNGPHNPFISNAATFTLSVQGVTAGTTISGVFFSFGTTAGDNVAGVPNGPTAVPEPSTIALALSGLVGVGFAGLRRLRRPRAATV